MPGTLEDYARAVTNVISTCRDAEQGFRAAADAVADPMLKELFEQYSLERGTFANELQAAVKMLGFDTPHPSGVGGLVHGIWMTIKGAFTGKNAHAILEEVERGEDWSVKTYREALALNLPIEVRSTIQKQYEQILQAHSRIRTLRDARAEHPTNTPPGPATPVAPA